MGAIGLLSAATAKAQIIVDNSDPGFSAPVGWYTGLGGGGQWGPDFRYARTGMGVGPATWSALIKGGVYKVSAWWISGVNRTPSAPYIVHHAGGSTTVLKNQQVNGGSWQPLGTYTMNGGVNQVQLSTWTASGYIIIADAIRWQP